MLCFIVNAIVGLNPRFCKLERHYILFCTTTRGIILSNIQTRMEGMQDLYFILHSYIRTILKIMLFIQFIIHFNRDLDILIFMMM